MHLLRASRTYMGAAASVAPLTLGFDAQTPEQISIRAPLSRAVAAGTTVDAEYRVAGVGSYLAGGRLAQVIVADLPGGAPVRVVDAFAGCIFDLTPGQTYDVRLTVAEPGHSTVQLTGTQATRALPAAAPTPNKTANPSTLAATLLTLVPGDCLQLDDGTYAAFTLLEAHSGSLGSPIYIRGTTRDGTIISASGNAITCHASHYVVENLTIVGSGVDVWNTPNSIAVIYSTGLSTPQTNTTFRNITATGIDQFVKGYEPVNGRLVYNVTATGNNTWDLTWTFNGIYGVTWNDCGVGGPGEGNCFFDSTFTGFGDTLKLTSSSGVVYNAANFMYRVACPFGGDDFAETDDSTGNNGIYDCEVLNSGTALSVDITYGGPIYFFRNRVGNTTRGPIKPMSYSQNVCLWNNTFVRTTSFRGTEGFYAASSGTNEFWSVKNNLIVYRGSGDVILWNCDLPNIDWDYNAIYPTNVNIKLGVGRGSYASLAAAKTALNPLMAHDVAATTNPFAATITLGSDYTTQYTGSMDWTLAGGVSELNAGVALPGITDGFTGGAPDIGAVISGRGIRSAGDPSVTGSTVPSWVASQTSQTWAVAPMGNTLHSLDPGQNAAINPNYPSAAPWDPDGTRQSNIVISAWCGAAYDETNDHYWLGVGGGHVNYYGNEVYRGDMNQEVPAWTMVRKPSGSIGFAAVVFDSVTDPYTGKYADGRPRAFHSYNTWTHVPGVGPVLMSLSGVGSINAGGKRIWAFINEADGEALFTAECTVYGSDQGGQAGTCYDPTRNAIWFFPDNTSTPVKYLIPSSGGAHTGSFSNVGSAYSLYGYMSACYLPDDDCVLVGSSSYDEATSGTWRVFDCATGTMYSPTFSSTPAIGTRQGQSQTRWVPSLGAACTWNNSSSPDLITRLTKPVNPRTGTWTVDTLPVSGSNTVTPTAKTSSGTFGRFAYSSRMGGFFVFNSTIGSVYFYKI